MRGLPILISLQALVSTISGVLISEMSFIGKMSIRFFFTEYTILKSWWKTALLLFSVQLVLILLLWFLYRLTNRRIAVITALILLLFGIAGIYLTYLDFSGTTHRLMKITFHSGIYVSWGAWLCTCVYFLLAPRQKESEKLNSGTLFDNNEV